MQTVGIPPKTNNDVSPHRSRKQVVAYVFVGLCIISLVGLIVVAMLPSYLVLSIPPPEDSYNQVGWSSTTRSTITTGSSTDFIWREDGTLAYENSNTIPSQEELAKYFNDQFVQMGWEQSDLRHLVTYICPKPHSFTMARMVFYPTLGKGIQMRFQWAMRFVWLFGMTKVTQMFLELYYSQ